MQVLLGFHFKFLQWESLDGEYWDVCSNILQFYSNPLLIQILQQCTNTPHLEHIQVIIYVVRKGNLTKFETSNIAKTRKAMPTKIGLHAFHINLYLHEYFESILIFRPPWTNVGTYCIQVHIHVQYMCMCVSLQTSIIFLARTHSF